MQQNTKEKTFHFRKEYENQYIRLYREVHGEDSQDISAVVSRLSNFSLLNYMNVLLIKKDCIPFTANELKMKLA